MCFFQQRDFEHCCHFHYHYEQKKKLTEQLFSTAAVLLRQLRGVFALSCNLPRDLFNESRNLLIIEIKIELAVIFVPFVLDVSLTHLNHTFIFDLSDPFVFQHSLSTVSVHLRHLFPSPPCLYFTILFHSNLPPQTLSRSPPLSNPLFMSSRFLLISAV